MIYKGQKLSDNLTKSQRDMFKYMIDRGDSVDEIVKIYTQPEPEQVEESILTGLAKDWSEYKYLTGKLAALKQEEQELTDLLRKTELEDD